MTYLLVATLTVVLAFLVKRIHRRLRFRLWSPIYLALLTYLLLGYGGMLLYGFTQAAGGTFYSLPVSRSALAWTMVQILVLLNMICLGSLTYLGVVRPQRPSVSPPAREPESTIERRGGLGLTRASSLGILLLALIPLVLIVLGSGVGNVWARSIYLPEEHQMLKILGSSLAVVAVFGSGMVSAGGRRSSRPIRLLGVLVFAAYEVIFFALATRQFAVAPAVFCFGALLARPRSKSLQLLAGLALIATPLLIQAPLNLRGLQSQGLSPFLAYLAGSGSSFFLQMFSPEQLRTYLLNTFYGFPLTAYVASAAHIPIPYLLTSINPLPGSLTSWYQVNAQLRVSEYIPFNSLGELLNYGLSIAGASFFLLGMILTSIDRGIRRRLARGSYLLPTVYIGLTVLFLLSTTQYNLRSSVRLLYYMLAISILGWMFRAFKPAGERRSSQASPASRDRAQSWPTVNRQTRSGARDESGSS